ncbi:hypothetical protein ACFFSY_02600 [Paenibacillus aurantiacus]|uniref:Flp pilus-assembly TadG-like N-terminal domain-containing protein n=1 Tax=Paenibacillus aurantiacus TaxID=1936118 RepID=A0ABV5KHW7_9BACL
MKRLSSRYPARCRFIVRSDGSVSIYMIAATAALVLVMSVLIDFARIAAFRKQTELAAHAGIRSALSAYDGELYMRYGLFGAGGSDRNELFAQAAKGQWTAANTGGSFRLVNGRYETSRINLHETLGRHDILKRQILEEMKYKAPVDFTLEVASLFAPAASAMKEAHAAVTMLENVRKLYDKREAHLQAALDLQKAMRDAAADAGAIIPFRNRDVAQSQTVLNVVARYPYYVAIMEADAYLEKDELPAYTDQIASYRDEARTVAGDLFRQSMLALRRHQSLKRRALEELGKAERLNEEMRAVIAQNEKNVNSGYDRVQKTKVPGTAAGSPSALEVSQLEQAGQSASSLLLNSEWFVRYREELSAQTAIYASFDAEAAGFQSSMNAALAGSGSAALLTDNAAQLRMAYEQYDAKYGITGTVIVARTQELETRQASDRERKKQEAKAEAKWNDIRRMLHNLTAVPQVAEHQELFDRVKQRAEANLAFNELGGEAGAGPIEQLQEEPGAAAEDAMRQSGGIFDGLADMLEGTRDTVYMNEFVINRFSMFDPQKMQAALLNGDSSEYAHALSLNNQETEYILYGFHSPAANVAAAAGELFAMRLAVRTMEGLIECRTMMHPLLILAGAVLYGLEQAAADMVRLVQTGTAPLSKYAPVEVAYRDYMRLFLLLHDNGPGRMARIAAVMEQNTGLQLAQVGTGLTGELRASVNVWFLPGVMNRLAKWGLLNGKVADGRYEMDQTVGMSYS